jgi:CubicO group peptidase (beta-lactamase class C family)
LESGLGRVFPGAVLAFGQPAKGEFSTVWAGQRGLTRDREPVGPDLAYDLASVTKILATAFLAAVAVDRGRLSLSATLGDLGWTGTVRNLTIQDLLAHRSGLAPWRPFYLLKPDRQDLRASYRQALVAEPLAASPGQATVYSDLNFLLLGFVLEDLFKGPLGQLFAATVAQPLGLRFLGYGPRSGPLAPTEDGFRVGGPLGYPGLPFLGPVPLGRVHDDNAAGLNGEAGHAGLFGDVAGVWGVLAHWAGIMAGRGGLATAKTLGRFLEPLAAKAGAPRALGFDLGEGPLAGFVGHWGYAGCGLWWDPAQDFGFALLTNRVHPTARNDRIASFRRELVHLLAVTKVT